VNVTDFSVVNLHVDDFSSARIRQHKLCATFSANVNINNSFKIQEKNHRKMQKHDRQFSWLGTIKSGGIKLALLVQIK
jgi:hypothetical protein